jgi:hypothetical protein
MSWLLKEAAFSLYFSLLTGIFGRDGFAETATTAIQSAAQRIAL